ncbi:unnamed protein product, partial [Effrenium voratum]
GETSELAAAWAENVATGEEPYRDDSVLVGNFGNTLLNSSFDTGVYIKHGPLSNVFENLENLTLAVASFGEDLQPLLASAGLNHPFRTIMILHSDTVNASDETVQTPRGPTNVIHLQAAKSEHLALCELASHVPTPHFVFTSARHFIASPAHVLITASGNPVLPYISASSVFCGNRPDCISSIAQAEDLFGVKLNYHHDTFETVFITDLTKEFCLNWELATAALPGYGDCGVVHGPTADDYVAWQISMEQTLLYVPKEKERVGWRPWTTPWTPHLPDARNCSVYTAAEHALQQSSLSVCGMVVEDPTACRATEGCTWRPIFGSGKCVITPKLNFPWQSEPLSPQSCDLLLGTTSTTTASSTGTSLTSSTTRTTTITTSLSTTSSTRTFTSATSTATLTSTSTRTSTGTATSLPGSCPAPTLGGQFDAAGCRDKFPGESCEVRCPFGFLGDPSLYTCTAQEIYVGTPPTCMQTTTMTSVTTTQTQLVVCSGGLPSTSGADVSDCYGKVNGETCLASCIPTYTGVSEEYYCNPSTALFEPVASGLVCEQIACSAQQLPSDFDTSGCVGASAGERCLVSCRPGFQPAAAEFLCGADGNFSGAVPSCQALNCLSDLLPALPGLDVTQCLGKVAGEACDVSCAFGFQGDSARYVCDLEGAFQGSPPFCERKACDLSPLDNFTSTCAGVRHGDRCTVSCAAGFLGTATEQSCVDGSLQGDLPACQPLLCSFSGLSIPAGMDVSNCGGVQKGETCQVTCVGGTTLVGSDLLECQSDGFFSKIQAACLPGSCGNLSSVQPFSPSYIGDSCAELTTGQVCTAFCEPGYTQEGNASVLICGDGPTTSEGYVEFLPGSQGSWPAEDSSGPTCNVNFCAKGIPNNPGLSHNCTAVPTGGRCVVTAELPYQLDSSADSVELTCDASGYLQGSLPGLLPAVCPNASFEASVGSTCQQIAFGGDCWAYCLQGSGRSRRYSCEMNGTGLALVSSEDINCTAARRLAALSVDCPSSAAAGVGLAQQQFLHDCTDKQNDEACIAHCAFGYDMQETEPAVFLCQSSALQGSLPSCLAKACNFSWPEGAGVAHDCEGVTTGGTCNATCGAGYTYAAGQVAAEFQCGASGAFQGTAPICERVSCGVLALSGRFSHNCRSKRFGDTCGVTCATGYHLGGWGAQFLCSASGSFVGTLPSCKGNPCPNPLARDVSLDSSGCENLTTAQSCDVRCVGGFAPNSSTLTCDESGYFTGNIPLCRALQCTPPPELSNSSLAHTCSEVSFNRSCAVLCAAGYFSSSNSSLEEWRCLENASAETAVELRGSVPLCAPASCSSGLPATSARTEANCSALSTGERCAQRCAEGYEGDGEGEAVFVCDSDGAARSNQTLSCQPVVCNTSDAGKLGAAGIASTCGDAVAYGSRCAVFCDVGYEADGVQSWTCAGPGSDLPPVDPLDANTSVVLRGRLPNCVPRGCFYNFPRAAQFSHDCDGIATGDVCTVRCAVGWADPSGSDGWLLRCLANGGLSGALPSCQVVTATMTSTTGTSTVTDLEVRVTVAGELQLEVSGEGFLEEAGAQRALAQVMVELLRLAPYQLSLTLAEASGNGTRRLAPLKASYSAVLAAETQQQADTLGANLTARVNATGLEELQRWVAAALRAELGEEKAALYALQVRAHYVDIYVGTRQQEVVAKEVAECGVQNLPAVGGAGAFVCAGTSCRAPCDAGGEALLQCSGGWQIQEECANAFSYVWVIVLGSAGALCCLVTICGLACACRGSKTAPEPEPQEPQTPSIRELPSGEAFQNWASQWEQSRPRTAPATDLPLVPPALPGTAGMPDLRRAAGASERPATAGLPSPPSRPPPAEMQRTQLAQLAPPPLPPNVRRDSSPRAADDLVLQVDELSPIAPREPEERIQDALEDIIEDAEDHIMVHVQRINGSLLAKIKASQRQSVADLVDSIKQVAGVGLNLTLILNLKVLRPEQLLEDCGFFDGCPVTAIRNPELLVAAAFDDGLAAVWSVESGKCERTFECRYGGVKSAALAQSGLILALGMVDGTVQLWNVLTGKFMRQYSGHLGAIFSVACSPNGKLLATGCFDGTSRLLNIENGRVIRVCSGHRGSIKSLAFGADSRTLATGSEDCTVKLWKVLERSGELTLSGHTGTVTAIAFSHHGKAIATGCDNGEVSAWSAVSGRLVWELPRAEGAVKTVAFSRDGVSLAVADFSGNCALYSASSRTCTTRVQCPVAAPRCMAFSPAAHLLICGNEAGELKVYGSDDGECRKTLEACAIPSMASSASCVAVCAGPVPKKSRRRLEDRDERTTEPSACGSELAIPP